MGNIKQDIERLAEWHDERAKSCIRADLAAAKIEQSHAHRERGETHRETAKALCLTLLLLDEHREWGCLNTKTIVRFRLENSYNQDCGTCEWCLVEQVLKEKLDG